MSGLIEALAAVVGAGHLRSGTGIPPHHLQDATRMPPCAPLALVRPANTQEVAAVIQLCAGAGCPVVVQGGLTGLAGGAHPLDGELILSMDRMDQIEDIDPVGRTMIVQAGTTLQHLQDAADAVGLFYPVDLGSRGSCTIGGNVATNAGGVQVLRYGMTRRQVLGMEAVLPDGRIVTGLNRMTKNNTGYDWKEILVGSEGTLGVITRLVLALQPSPGDVQTALCACGDIDSAFALQRRLESHFPGGLLAFEGMWQHYLEITLPALSGKAPFEIIPPIALLVEVSGPVHDGASAETLSDVLAQALENGLIDDALLARSLAERKRFWSWRDANSAFRQLQPPGIHFDISLPRPAMAEAIAEWQVAVDAGQPGGSLAVYGHLGDGNLHVALFPSEGTPINRALAVEILESVARRGGSISAEHGIGTRRRSDLPLSRTAMEISFMRDLKSFLDPNCLLGRGRVL